MDLTDPELTEKKVAELYESVEKTPEIIPSDVTEFFLRKSGFACEDPVVIKMVSLAAQKFVTDLAKESYAFSKKRQGLSGQSQQKNRRSVLLLEDVAKAAGKFGISVNKPEYFADTPTAGLSDAQAGAVGAGGEKRALPPTQSSGS